MAVDPTGTDLKRLLIDDDGGPCVMLNLLRYSDAGVSSYREYSVKALPFLESVGARVLYSGTLSTALISPDDWEWDSILLVEYPSRTAFSRMVADPEYQAITGLRTAGLDAAVLQASVPWSSTH